MIPCYKCRQPIEQLNAYYNDLGKPYCSDMCRALDYSRRAKANQARRDKHAVLTSLGLKRVKGSLGGAYYE